MSTRQPPIQFIPARGAAAPTITDVGSYFTSCYTGPNEATAITQSVTVAAGEKVRIVWFFSVYSAPGYYGIFNLYRDTTLLAGPINDYLDLAIVDDDALSAGTYTYKITDKQTTSGQATYFVGFSFIKVK